MLNYLVADPTTDQEFVSHALISLKSVMVDWLQEYDAEEHLGYKGLTLCLLEKGIIGEETFYLFLKISIINFKIKSSTVFTIKMSISNYVTFENVT